MIETQTTNRLIHETSPYLLQHAHNPVNWYPWGEEAFAEARREDKPIFLSIGYSTCHWCHVMERESFEDEKVADLMNKVFVPVKVDREERPDIDSIYMSVCQMMIGGGGWPLTIIMTPDQKPFFAGTYFPKENRFGRIGLIELIKKIEEIWEHRRDEILDSADEITRVLRREPRKSIDGELNEDAFSTAYKQLTESFDRRYGGFGTAPKFPTPHNLLFLLRYWKRYGEKDALEMVEKTLRSIREGGVFDQIGYGVHRYSTDARWFLPHFEKMLYDQAMLAMAYTEAYQAIKNEKSRQFYKKTVDDIFTYLIREMKSKEGGFYSAEDADSEGIEGKFYLWSEVEIKRILSAKEADLIVKYFNTTMEGNYREEAGSEQTGENILYIEKSLEQVAKEIGLTKQQAEDLLEESRKKLFISREERIHPYKDDKVLTDWNGLIIAALAKGAQVFREQKYLDAAEKGVDFFLNTMRDKEGRLLHRYRGEKAAILGFLDDYSFLTWGLIELYEASFKLEYLKEAINLTDFMLEHFWDEKNGGFFLTADFGENVLVRKKEIYDGAVPSGNSVAMLNLIRLGRMTGKTIYEEKGVEVGRAFAGTVLRSPVSYTQLLNAVDFGIGPSYEVVIAGPSDKNDTKLMLDTVKEEFLPNKVVLFRPTDTDKPEITEIAGYTKELSGLNGEPTAYICQNYHCQLPITDRKKILELLNNSLVEA